MKRSITVLEVVAILFGSTVGVGVLAAPRLAVDAGGTGAPLVSLIGVLIAFAGAVLVTILGLRFPGESIAIYGKRVLGKWTAAIMSLVIAAYFAILTALSAREFGKISVVAVLQKTPTEITTLIMIVLVAIAARNSITTFSYIHLFYFPLIMAPVAIISILSLKNANFLYLQPIWSSEPLASMAVGSLTTAGLLQGGFILAIVLAAVRRPSKAMKATIIGMGLSGGVYVFTMIAALAVFGPQEIKLLYWPTLEMAKTTLLPGEVLERLDAIFISVWVIAVFTSIYSTFYITIEVVSQTFGLKDSRMLSLPFATGIFFIAMLPPNIVQLYRVITLAGQYGLILTFGYPLVLWVVALVRRVRGVELTE
jgi:spore germination protein